MKLTPFCVKRDSGCVNIFVVEALMVEDLLKMHLA